MMEIIKFAELRNVELFEPGTHNGSQFTDEDIEEMVASSNACLPYILQSIQEGYYAGNEELNAEIKRSGKPIPGLINLGHQRYLKDLKKHLDGIRVNFAKVGDWLTATITNVKDDIALMLQEVFNLRSIELIKELHNPMDGKTYKNVVRSIGFLPDNIPPAVGGQNPQLAVEYSVGNEHIITLYSHFENPLKKEDDTMAHDNEKNADDVVKKTDSTTTASSEFFFSDGDILKTQLSQLADKIGESIMEQDAIRKTDVMDDRLTAFESQLAEMSKKLSAREKEIELNQKEKEALKNRLESAEKKVAAAEKDRELQAVEMYCKELASERLSDSNGHEYMVSKIFEDAVREIVSYSDNSSIIEFSEEKKMTARDVVKEFARKVVDLAVNQTLLVPMNAKDFKQKFMPSEETQKPREVNRSTIMEFYGEQAKISCPPNAKEHDICVKAFDIAAEDEYRKIYNGGK
jgi:hypothetical protein